MSLEKHEYNLIVAAIGLFCQKQTGDSLAQKLHEKINEDRNSGKRSIQNADVEKDRLNRFIDAMSVYRKTVQEKILYDDFVKLIT